MDPTFYARRLRCSDGSLYVGHTDNLEVRLAQHRSGAFEGCTARRRPVQLVWTDTFRTRDDAFALVSAGAKHALSPVEGGAPAPLGPSELEPCLLG
jgi:hypothetical protein